ncbi:uncharacterized protein [Procambarus clarkii]|uniref:uncharacterized protein n=1 Tax=Procambarus clarkii TaxID=6728 RepID=UPI003744163C
MMTSTTSTQLAKPPTSAFPALPENTGEAAAVTTNNTLLPVLLHLADKLAGNDVNLYIHIINRLLITNGLPTVTVLLPAPPPGAGPGSDPATGPTTSPVTATPPTLATPDNDNTTSKDDNGPPETPTTNTKRLSRAATDVDENGLATTKTKILAMCCSFRPASSMATHTPDDNWPTDVTS